jgi:hypothetical protein
MTTKSHDNYLKSLVFGVAVTGSCVARCRDLCNFLVRNLNTLHLMLINRVSGVTGPHHLRMETCVFVSGVVYCTGGAICLKQLVVTFDLVAVTFLGLLLDVLSVSVLHSVLELVLGMGL